MPHGSYSYPGHYVGRQLPRTSYDARYGRFRSWWYDHTSKPRGWWREDDRDARKRSVYNACAQATQDAERQVQRLEGSGIRHGQNATVGPITGRNTYHNQLRLVRARDWYAFRHRCQDFAYYGLPDSMRGEISINSARNTSNARYNEIVNGPSYERPTYVRRN